MRIDLEITGNRSAGTGTQPEVPNHTNIVNNSENAKKRPPEQTERAFSKARYLDQGSKSILLPNLSISA